MKKFLVLFLAVFMVVGMASVASAAPVVTFDLPTDPIRPGDIFTVGVSVEDTAPIGILTFGAFIDYDDGYLRFVSAEVDSSWKNDPNPTPPPDTKDSGFIQPELNSDLWTVAGWTSMGLTAPNNFEEGSDLLQSAFIDYGGLNEHFADEIPLGIITFECVSPGDSLLFAHERVEVDDLVSGTITSADVDWENSFATVSPVPIPGAALLLGSGLLGLMGIKRRFHL
jgi:hypothetical protein